MMSATDVGRQIGEHHTVDEHRRFVVAEPDACGFKQPEIGRSRPAESCPCLSFEGFVDLLIAVHLGNNGVAQIDPAPARRRGVEEVVETRRLEDVVGSQPEPTSYRLRRVGRDIATTALDVPKYVDQSRSVVRVPIENLCDLCSHGIRTARLVKYFVLAATDDIRRR